jgi:hypothetical protein
VGPRAGLDAVAKREKFHHCPCRELIMKNNSVLVSCLSGREADNSPPSSAQVKECVELYIHSLSTPSWRGAQKKKSTRQLYLYL